MYLYQWHVMNGGWSCLAVKTRTGLSVGGDGDLILMMIRWSAPTPRSSGEKQVFRCLEFEGPVDREDGQQERRRNAGAGLCVILLSLYLHL